MSLTTDTPEDEGAPAESTASGKSARPKLMRWILVLLALQAAAIIGLGAALIIASASQTDRVIAASDETRAAIEELQEVVDGLPTTEELQEVVDGLPSHDPQAELERGDLLCATQDGDVSYRPGLGGVFVHECRYFDSATARRECEAHDIYGNSWSCSDR